MSLTSAARQFAALAKVRISLLSTLTAVAGYACARRGLDGKTPLLVLGVFLLAAGACALNQFQERRQDALMARTRNRPLPSGGLMPTQALAFAFALLLAGFWTLLPGFGPSPALLGLAAVAWYNGVYTYLKRLTAFAVVPGALVGAIPPVLGWVAGGGRLSDPQSAALAFFFFIWQVPHFWVLITLYGDEYEGAGFPSITRALPGRALSRLTFVWTGAAAASALLLPALGAVRSPLSWVLLAASGFGLVVAALPLLGQTSPPPVRTAFRAINAFALAVVVVLVADPTLAALLD